jgi:4-hydroxy-tetrahydrodipicolinate reductase
MGTLARTTIESADDMAFVGGFARVPQPARQVYDDLDALFAHGKPDVLIDFTTPPTGNEVSMLAVLHGVRPVVGASAWSDADREAVGAAAQERGIGALCVPNFAIGAVLMMRFAEQAAKLFPKVEIVEMHHETKKDAPSGTARLTAQRIRAHGGPADVPIHSVRLPGAIAHQEVLFGGNGELLTIRHDSLSRESFAAGILAAVRAVVGIRGLVIGLDSILEPA